MTDEQLAIKYQYVIHRMAELRDAKKIRSQEFKDLVVEYKALLNEIVERFLRANLERMLT